MTAVEVVHLLAFPHQTEEGSFDAQAAGGDELEQTSRDNLVAALTRDLNGPHRAHALQGLCDMLLVDGKRRVDFKTHVPPSVHRVLQCGVRLW